MGQYPRANNLVSLAGILCAIGCLPILAQDSRDPSQMVPDVLSKEQRRDARGMIDRYLQRRTTEFNVSHRQAWYKIKTREQWEKFRDERIARLRQSLGHSPTGKPKKSHRRHQGGDGFQIENVVYESRPGQLGNGQSLRPGQASQGDARHADCPRPSPRQNRIRAAGHGHDLGPGRVHGAGHRSGRLRRTPAASLPRAADHAKPSRRRRQDYYFRYDTGIQLQLLGDSLMGWMAWDLMRGVDLLLARDGIDPARSSFWARWPAAATRRA